MAHLHNSWNTIDGNIQITRRNSLFPGRGCISTHRTYGSTVASCSHWSKRAPNKKLSGRHYSIQRRLPSNPVPFGYFSPRSTFIMCWTWSRLVSDGWRSDNVGVYSNDQPSTRHRPCTNPESRSMHHGVALVRCQPRLVGKLWNMWAVMILFLFLHHSSSDSLLIFSLSLHTVTSERPPPKRSFSLTCCAWFHCSISTYPLWMSFFLHVLPQRSLTPSITQPSFPFISILALVLWTLLDLCTTYPPI